MSFGAEGLAQALAVLEDVASKRKAYRGRNVDLSQFIVFIANSNSLNLPVMDVRQFFGQFLNGNWQVFVFFIFFNDEKQASYGGNIPKKSDIKPR